jgi:microcin C transport system permease protein
MMSLPEDAVEEIRRYYGFDKPVHVRYIEWLGNVVQLDLGNSYIYQEPVWDVIKARFPISLFLGLTGFLLNYLICVPLGVLKAVKHRSRFDFISSALVFLGYSVPGWALGTVLLVLFGGGSFWSVFPLGGFRPDNWEYLPLSDKIAQQAWHLRRSRS